MVAIVVFVVSPDLFAGSTSVTNVPTATPTSSNCTCNRSYMSGNSATPRHTYGIVGWIIIVLTLYFTLLV